MKTEINYGVIGTDTVFSQLPVTITATGISMDDAAYDLVDTPLYIEFCTHGLRACFEKGEYHNEATGLYMIMPDGQPGAELSPEIECGIPAPLKNMLDRIQYMPGAYTTICTDNEGYWGLVEGDEDQDQCSFFRVWRLK